MQIEALLLLIPALTALIYQEKCIFVFLGTTVFCLIFGQLLKGKRPEKVTVYSSSGYVSVALSWIAMSFAGAIPLYFSGYFSNPVDALFEIVSGFTTTGATILSNVEILPRSILIWRSLSHWVGGMGILVFMLAILPITGASGMNLMRAESPGPSVGKLFPKVRSTAKILYSIYFFLTLAEMIVLIIVGCPLFDSINLALATAGTGGFGVLNSSAGDYNSLIQITLTVFMILFGVNFNIYFLIHTKQYKEAFKSEELRTYFGIIGTAIVLISANTYHLYSNIGETLKHSSFQVASIITTTGFSTVDFNLWPEFSRTVLVMLMFIGACAGSTGGGIKVSRIIIMAKTVRKEIAFIRHPRNVRKTRFEGKQVEHEVVRAINIFLISYLAIFVFSVLFLSINNYDGVTNFTAVASALNNIGPGLNLVGPMSNFGHFSNFSKLILIMDMLAGRLEIFPILMLGNLFIKRKQWN
jgi:trk system potassium uptake protein TrkH